MDLIVRNGKVVNSDSSFYADIGIKDGKIICIGDVDYFDESVKTIDATGKLVMPGQIDAHIHIAAEQGEYISKDNVEIATKAAAIGGMTTMVQFAIPVGDERPIDALEMERNATKPNSVIDYSFHGAITRLNDQSLADIEDILTGGYPTIKMFTVYRGEVMLEPLGVLRALECIGKNNGLALIHAENVDIIEALIKQHVDAGKTTPYYHMLSRPPISEVSAVAGLLPIIESTNASTLFVHMTTSQVCDYIRWAKSRMPVFTEFCPHYLSLTDEVYSRKDGQNYICSPPMRTQADQDGMWKMIEDGLCDIISSDHSGFDLEQKARNKDFFPKAPNGLPGIETRGLLVYSEGVAKGRITENEFVRMLSTQPAKLMGMFPQKGIISVGADADIVVYDPSFKDIIRSEDLHMGTDYTPYEGFEIVGKPICTILRGNILAKDGEYVGGDFRGMEVSRTSPIIK